MLTIRIMLIKLNNINLFQKPTFGGMWKEGGTFSTAIENGPLPQINKVRTAWGHGRYTHGVMEGTHMGPWKVHTRGHGWYTHGVMEGTHMGPWKVHTRGHGRYTHGVMEGTHMGPWKVHTRGHGRYTHGAVEGTHTGSWKVHLLGYIQYSQ